MKRFRENLLVQFSALSFVVMAVIAATLAISLSNQVRTDALDALAAEAVGSASGKVRQALAPSDIDVPMTGARYESFHSFVNQFVASERTARVKLWAPDGTVIYSNDPAGVGDRFPDNENLKKALQGEITKEVKLPQDPENEREKFLGTLMEVYTPLYFSGDSEPRGVLEIYQYFQPTAERINSLQRWIFGSVGIGFLVLYGTLFLVVRGGWMTINQQQSKLTRVNAELEVANASLRESEAHFKAVAQSASDGIISTNSRGNIVFWNKSAQTMFGHSKQETLGESLTLLMPKRYRNAFQDGLERVIATGESHLMGRVVEMQGVRKGGEEFPVEISLATWEVGEENYFSAILRDITERKRVEEERERLLQSEREQRLLAEALGRVGRALSATLELPELLNMICEESVALFDVDAAFVWLLQRAELVGFAGHGQGVEQFIKMRIPLSDPEVLGTRVVRERRPIFVNDAVHSNEVSRDLIEIFQAEAILGAPLMKGDRVVGALMILDTKDAQKFRPIDAEVVSMLGSHAAVAIENAQLYEGVRQRVQQLAALRQIDLAIMASVDLGMTLTVLLEQVLTQLEVDAANVLLLDPQTQRLDYAEGRGFRTSALQHTSLRLGESYAGRVALERRIINISDLRDRQTDFLRSPTFSQEGFVTYYGVPLIAKGEVKGVLEIFHRALLEPDQEWLEFMEALAGQAAIAIDNASLFENLQRSNAELVLAYDATLEGWSRALELRDDETEGHTQRVTEMTERLVRIMGLRGVELTHVRRGALLHDVGKIGVPDGILLKPGPLTEEEWTIMRKHPQYAYEMLYPIAYLRPALDIPYCHHEKWDGSGYPRGLKGEQIPLPARIFAVVDVWDALTSDRPYRKAWPEERALEYIQEQAGSHFDPRVVRAFSALMNELEEKDAW